MLQTRVHRSCLVLLTLVLPIAACGSSTEPVDGVYSLVRIEGKALPADMGPMPPRQGVQNECRMIVYEGSLSLQSDNKSFSWIYRTRDSCDIGVFPDSPISGSYDVSGNVITFHAQAGPGNVITYSGSRVGSHILITDDFYRLDFMQ